MDRPRRTSIKRRLFGATPSPEKPDHLSKEERRKMTCARYRERLKKDPDRLATYKMKEKLQKQSYKEGLSDEKKAIAREKTRLRNIAYRERQRQKQTSPAASKTTPKPSTRADVKKLEEHRERNRLAQQKRRQNMHPQKKRRERERNRKYYYANKSSVMPASASGAPSKSKSVSTPIPSRSTISRLKRKMGKNLFVSLKGLVKSVSKKHPEPLKDVGIVYTSPSKRKCSSESLQSASKSKIPPALLKRRDKHSLIVKRFLQSKATPGKLYRKKRKLETETSDFLDTEAVFLPGKKGLNSKDLSVKKALNRSIVNLHRDFIETHGPLISRATFFRRRPEHILSFSKTPFRQCLCEVCINPMLKIKALQRLDHVGCAKIETLRDLIGLTLCEGEQRKCLKRACGECGAWQIRRLLPFDVDMDITVGWHKWDRLKRSNQVRVELVKKEGSVMNLMDELKEELIRLPLHDFVHRWQSRQFSALIKNVPQDWAVVVLDFAENYMCRQQDQPQSAYYGYSQVTVHPCVIYYGCTCGERVTLNWTFVSDILSHSANMVHTISQRILDHLVSLNIKKTVIFSDGCASQYKSRLPFFFLQSYAGLPMKIERCYFGARHGKNPCDALGGLLKQAASRAVRARTANIQNANDLLQFASLNLNIELSCGPCTHVSRKFFLLTEADISDVSSSAELSTLQGTRQLHSVCPILDGLLVRNLTCFCESCIGDDFSSCQSKDYVDRWKIVRNFVTNNSHLNEGFLVADAEDTAEESTVSVEQPIEHCRESFFAQVQAKFNALKSYHDLKLTVREMSASFNRFPLPKLQFHTVVSVEGSVDSIALELFKPTGILHLYPVNTVPDGNCVPRTLSLHCFGDQEHHVEMRCRVVHELVSNSFDYLCLEGAELNFLVQHSDCNINSTSSAEDVFQLEALSVSRSSTFMGMWQLMAAANVLQTNIISIYPKLGPQLYQSFFNRTVFAREPLSAHCFPVFWSSTEKHSEDMPLQYWTANHLVPLLPIDIRTVVTD